VTLSGRARSVVLTAHIVVSVGWLGAVAAFAALAVVGLASQDAQRVRGVYLVMEPVGWFLLVPLAVASLLTGLAQSLGGAWGLFRHYWVVFKLLINVLAILLLLMYMQTLEHFADLASRDDVSALRDPSPLLHSVLALILLLVATTLGVFKPRGLTPYGRRRRT
jgi:uncharacterized membrane protein